NERYLPHVIEPSAGLSRGVLAVLCEAYTQDSDRPSGVFMKFHPRVAPIKAGIFPLVNKDGLPDIASAIHRDLRGKYRMEYDPKQSIGKRYARMDEAGTPFCFTVDAGTLETGNVTVRHRDTLAQETVNKDQIGNFLEDQLG
ncbi:MAG: His/Gly/Thr/Pro-type tRNA ligase C-terminal domain-containing protein, partial [Planctomycetota bacterium]